VLNDRNPLGPRPGWSGDSGGWTPVLINLPPGAAGQSVQLRWRLATVFGRPDGGWWVDSIVVTDPQCLPPVANPVIYNWAIVEHSLFQFTFDTVSGRTYIVECKTNLDDAAWQTLQTVPGSGFPQTTLTPMDMTGHRFYRFRVQ
jgi:hypothetical protein